MSRLAHLSGVFGGLAPRKERFMISVYQYKMMTEKHGEVTFLHVPGKALRVIAGSIPDYTSGSWEPITDTDVASLFHFFEDFICTPTSLEMIGCASFNKEESKEDTHFRYYKWGTIDPIVSEYLAKVEQTDDPFWFAPPEKRCIGHLSAEEQTSLMKTVQDAADKHDKLSKCN